MNRSIEIRPRPPGSFLSTAIHPRLSQIYAARHVKSDEDIDYRLENLLSPEDLPGIADALDILEDCLERDARIVFVGDFDADGATSTVVGLNALAAMGASEVDYLVPNRFEHGYGLSAEIVRNASKKRPDLLITVDNGIANVEGVEVAKDHGMSVIITDHHLPGDRLPRADAIVNPNLNGSPFGSNALAGVGVIFYLMVALRSRLRDRGWFGEDRPQPNLGELLDLVAIGTVADLVPLDRNNRILVAKGLDRINSGRSRPGVSALLCFCSGRIGEISTSDLGFAVAPRLNAAGRLKDMSLGIECLLSDDSMRASDMAGELDRLNKERREIESKMKKQAIELVDAMHLSGVAGYGLCLYDERWHQGIVGLVASRIKDRTGKPVIAFADAGDDELKGSARSVTGLHIRDILSDICTHHPGLIVRFGGHAAAAGLSLRKNDLKRFSDAFSQTVESHSSDEGGYGIVYSDGSLGDEELTLDFAGLLRCSGPWGQHFPEPMFDDEFNVLDSKTVGNGHLKLRVRKKGSATVIDAIAFNHDGMVDSKKMENGVRMVYTLDINEYRGVRKPQLIVRHLLPAQDESK